MDTGVFLNSTKLTSDPAHMHPSISKGLTAKQVEYAVTKYRSHRRIGPSIMMSLAMLENPT